MYKKYVPAKKDKIIKEEQWKKDGKGIRRAQREKQ